MRATCFASSTTPTRSKELRELENDPALSAADFLDTLELEGIAQGSLKQKGLAKIAFQKLLTIAPARKLTGSHAPRVMTPFYEASLWGARERLADARER